MQRRIPHHLAHTVINLRVRQMLYGMILDSVHVLARAFRHP